MSVRRHTLSVWHADRDLRAWALQRGNASMILGAFAHERPRALVHRGFDESLRREDGRYSVATKGKP